MMLELPIRVTGQTEPDSVWINPTHIKSITPCWEHGCVVVLIDKDRFNVPMSASEAAALINEAELMTYPHGNQADAGGYRKITVNQT